MVDQEEKSELTFEEAKAKFFEAVDAQAVEDLHSLLIGEMGPKISLLLIQGFRCTFASSNMNFGVIDLFLRFSRHKNNDFRVAVIEDAVKKTTPEVLALIVSCFAGHGLQLKPELADQIKQRLAGYPLINGILSQLQSTERVTEDQMVRLALHGSAGEFEHAIQFVDLITSPLLLAVMERHEWEIVEAAFDALLLDGYNDEEHHHFVVWMIEHGVEGYQEAARRLIEE